MEPAYRPIWGNRACAILYQYWAALPPGGVWILPANVCYVVPFTLMKAGHRALWVDISPEDLCMDKAAVLALVEQADRNIAGILWWDTYGAEQDTRDFLALLAAKGIKVVYDGCASMPMLTPPTNGFADLYLYSTGYAKYIDLGEGSLGWLHSQANLASATLVATTQALQELDQAIKSGQAFSAEQVAGLVDLPWLSANTKPLGLDDPFWDVLKARLPEVAAHKARLNAIYRQHLPQAIQLPERYHTWRFQVLIPEAAHLVQTLLEAGLFASRHYLPIAQILAQTPTPVAEALQQNIVNLFNDLYFSEEQAYAVCSLINAHWAKVQKQATTHPFSALLYADKPRF